MLTRAAPALPEELDPQRHFLSTSRPIYADLFTGLTATGADGSVIAGVAESWTISEDGKTYRFNIRDDAFWSDGQPVTALDFVLAFKRLFALGSKSKLSSLYEHIEGSAAQSKIGLPITSDLSQGPFPGVMALDSKILQFRLSKPLPYFLSLLAIPPAYPVPHHQYAKHGENWIKPVNSLSNGPYQLENFQPNTQITMRKNPFFYANDKVTIEAVRYSLVPEGWTILRMMVSGKADISYSLPHYQIDAGYDVPGFEMYRQQRLSLYSFNLNHNKDSLKDVSIRKALYLATNRAQILDIMGNHQVAVAGLVPPMGKYTSPIEAPPYDSALIEAQRLMHGAGYSEQNLLQLSLKTLDGLAEHRLAALIKRLWRKIYVDLVIEQSDPKTFTKDFYAANFDVIRRSWVAGYADPYNFLQLYTHAYSPKLFKEEDPILQGLFAAADNDPDNRYSHLQQAERHLMDKYPSIPLFSSIKYSLVADRVQGWSTSPSSVNNTRWLWFKTADGPPAE